jgi:ABC-type branched-subunit amino acid transport system substrate-binding protein
MVTQAGACAPAIRQIRQFMSKDIKILGDNNWYNPYIRKEAGEMVNGIYYYMNPAVFINPDPLVQMWLKECKKRIGYYHEIMARAIIGMTVMREAIIRAKTTDAIPVLKEVHKMRNIPTLMGPFTYDPRDGEGLKTGFVVTPVAGEDLSKDRIVFTYTVKDPLYEKGPDYTRFFGKDYSGQLLKFHRLN